MMTYYLLKTRSRSPANLNQEWFARYSQEFLHSCGHRKVKDAGLDVVVDYRGEYIPLNFFTGALDFYIMRNDLYRFLCPEAEQWLRFGRLSDCKGRVVKELRTFDGEPRLRIRGGAQSTCHFCPDCGQLLYWPWPPEEYHILAADVDGRPIYRATSGSLVINDAIRDRFRVRRWPKLTIEEISVVDDPRDGLPHNLAQVAPADIAERAKKGTGGTGVVC